MIDEMKIGETTNEVRDEEKDILRVGLGCCEVEGMLSVKDFNRVLSSSHIFGGICHSV